MGQVLSAGKEPNERLSLSVTNSNLSSSEALIMAFRALAIPTLSLCDGAHDKLLKDFEINIVELANVQAALAPLVFPEL